MTSPRTIARAEDDPIFPGRPAEAAPLAPSVVSEVAEVLANDAVNAEYRHLVVRCGPVCASAVPGQFFHLLCPHSDGAQPFLRRPMSLYGVDPIRREVAFLYKVAGAGPLGTGFTLDPKLRHIVAVGRGAGLATLAPLAQAAKANGISVTAIFSARHPELLVSVDLFKGHGAKVIAVTDAGSGSGPSNVERILRGLMADGRCQAFYTCGSSRLLRVQQRLAREFGIPGQVAMEQQMACGIGLCFCCVRDFNVGGEIVARRVCWDGPVFDMMEALP
jgi:dihydroorotate dehydrogenase electron transfer subunit